MKILVIGGGGREHALVWKIAQSPMVEKILLITYLILFSLIIFFANYESNNEVENFYLRSNLLDYYDSSNLT